MALTAFQREVCLLLARHRIESGESYVAGGAALNAILRQPRVSRDVDVFHDSREAVNRSWEADRDILQHAGYDVQPLTERPTYVEAVIEARRGRVVVQWAEDSAYRYFPLVEHPDFGLTLHPFDLATNKVLALVGRLEVRDWLDVIACCEYLQPLGYLAWAATGKDPGLSPTRILSEARRSSRYTREEVSELAFEGPPPDAGELSRSWKDLLDQAVAIVDILPGEHCGSCVLDASGELLRAAPDMLSDLLEQNAVWFHYQALYGSLPIIVQR